MNKKLCHSCHKESDQLFNGSTLEEKICHKCLEKQKYNENENDCYV